MQTTTENGTDVSNNSSVVRKEQLQPVQTFEEMIILDNNHFVTICDDEVRLYSDNGDLEEKLRMPYTPITLTRFGPYRVVVNCDSRRLCIVKIEYGTSLLLLVEVITTIQYRDVFHHQNDELICVGGDDAIHRLEYEPSLGFIAACEGNPEHFWHLRHEYRFSLYMYGLTIQDYPMTKIEYLGTETQQTEPFL